MSDNLQQTVVVRPGDLVMLTTPEHEGRTCVYVRLVDGKLEVTGGQAIRTTPETMQHEPAEPSYSVGMGHAPTGDVRRCEFCGFTATVRRTLKGEASGIKISCEVDFCQDHDPAGPNGLKGFSIGGRTMVTR